MPETIDPKVLGQRLVEARRASGVTQQDASKLLGCSRPTLIAIEKGTRPAKPDEIIRLAEFYGRSVHELVRPGAPRVALAPHLRAAAGLSDSDDTEVEAGIRELEGLAGDYSELERLADAEPHESYPPEVRVPARANVVDFAEDVAARERSRLHLGDQPVLNLRQVLENDVGLRIFCAGIPSRIAGMYAHVADLGYCVLLNRKHPPERRRFTLAHEYGHFLTERHKPGIDYLSSQARKPASERFSDGFAMSFLMPETGIRRHYYDITSSTGDFRVEDLCRLANVYFVSLQAVCLRLEGLGLIDRGTWDFLRESEFSPSEARLELAIEAPTSEPSDPYPARYKYLAVQALGDARISEGQLARFLRCSRVEAREIVFQCKQQTDIDQEGDEFQFVAPFGQSLLKGMTPATG